MSIEKIHINLSDDFHKAFSADELQDKRVEDFREILNKYDCGLCKLKEAFPKASQSPQLNELVQLARGGITDSMYEITVEEGDFDLLVEEMEESSFKKDVSMTHKNNIKFS